MQLSFEDSELWTGIQISTQILGPYNTSWRFTQKLLG